MRSSWSSSGVKGPLGLMLWSMDQTELDIVLMSLVLQGEIVAHIFMLSPSVTDPGELSPASMARHRRSRNRSSSYDSVSLRRRSRSSSRSRVKKKKSHKKSKHSSTSRSSSRRSSSHSSRERGRKRNKQKHSKLRSSKHDKREKKYKSLANTSDSHWEVECTSSRHSHSAFRQVLSCLHSL